MEIFTTLKYSGKKQASNLDVERMRQRRVKKFTLISLAIGTHAF
jgi:hypothetical protein